MKILLIEDDPFLLSTMLHFFAREDCHVVATTSPELVISAIDCNHFQTVVTDVRMDPVDGITLVKAIRKAGFAGQIIVTSAFYLGAKEETDALKIDAFFEKPFDVHEMYAAIREWPAKNRHSGEEAAE
ncbi:MAG: response regulator [Alphaproteobacteria bacterium]|uniref:Response regulator n=1 Tax=Candidatus Nitrobium versatile TaxID=2884831 RepID=A0A953J8P4_9BACT|nr:response regulator [Candidatus Nitrobium versatile]